MQILSSSFFLFFFNFETIVDLIWSLKFATNKRIFLQKNIFRLGQLGLLAFAPLPPHLPLFNSSIMGIEFYLFGGRERS